MIEFLVEFINSLAVMDTGAAAESKLHRSSCVDPKNLETSKPNKMCASWLVRSYGPLSLLIPLEPHLEVNSYIGWKENSTAVFD